MVLSKSKRCLQFISNYLLDEQGRLTDGTDVAVKKLIGMQTTQTAEEDFLTEVRLLASVRHRNLVRLLGCCTRGHEHEFMSNKSLDKHLFGRVPSSILCIFHDSRYF